MADENALSARVTKLEANYANVSLSDRAGLARLDVSCARRNTGSYVKDLRSILQNNAQLMVRVVPMDEENVMRLPQNLRRTVRRMYQWDVKFFRTDSEPAPQRTYKDPSRYFQDSGNPIALPRDYVGRVLSALMQIVSMLNNIQISKLLPLVKTHFKVKGIANIDLHLRSADQLQRFIQSYPQYFEIDGGNVKRCAGFPEEVFSPAFTAKALEIYPSTGQASSGHGQPHDYQDVLDRVRIIESVEECRRVLEPFLLKARSEKVILGLDCEGVNLGRPNGCLTLVQISTWDGQAFLFDAFKNPQLLKGTSSLKKILEHDAIIKVIHDCKSDTHSLYHEFDVRLRCIFDTSIAMRTIMEQVNRCRSYRIGFKALCEMLGEGASHKDDEFVKKMVETKDFWKIRPLTDEMIYYAASDALCLVPSVYQKLDGMLTPIWRDLFTWWCVDTMASIQRNR